MRKFKKFNIIFALILCAFFAVFAERAESDFGGYSGSRGYNNSSSRSRSRSSSSSNSSPRSSSSYNNSSRRSSSGSSYSHETNSGGGNLGAFVAGALLGSNNNADSNITSGSGSDDDDDGCGDNVSTIVGALFILFIVWKFVSALRAQKKYDYEYPQSEPMGQLVDPIEDYLKLDPNFDERAICDKLSNLYVQMQDAWHNKDIRSLRPYFDDAFYNQLDRQLDEMRKHMRTDYTEHIAVLGVNLIGYYQRKGMDYLVANVRTRIVSYVLDDRTGELLSGDKKREIFMEYEYELVRKSGVITQENTDDMHSATCPHCGAPLSINASAQC
nr:TIM44-like domain-containing protein [Synergistaceae bacterium]